MAVNLNFDDYFDGNGNMTELEHIADIKWNYRDNIAQAKIVERENAPDDAEYYVYDSSGNRVLKVKETYKGNGTIEVEETIYLGGVEIKRIRIENGSSKTEKFERSDLHVMDDTSRIAIVNHWTMDENNHEINSQSELNQNKVRYQYGNHLGSASIELDSCGKLISYEEYFPYGGTSFIAGTNQKEIRLKEYRYTGKERDDATGLYYYGARYYAPWLGRWLSADPLKRLYPIPIRDKKNDYGQKWKSKKKGLKEPINKVSGRQRIHDENELFPYEYYNRLNKKNQLLIVDLIEDGLNWYVYTNNNPLKFLDLTGLFDIETGEIQSKDTLWKIRKQINEKYDTDLSIQDIAKVNNIKNIHKINIGDFIKLPFENIELQFDYKSLYLFDKSYKIKSSELNYPAVSGTPGKYDPLEPGLYKIDPSKTLTYEKDSKGLIDKLKWRLKSKAWGYSMTHLEPVNVSELEGESHYYIHGGTEPGSEGCIDLTSNNEAFHKWFLEQNKVLNVRVLDKIKNKTNE